MKLLVSDYDGTLKPFSKEPSLIDLINFEINKKAIKKFMNEDNQFVITTGRNTHSIKKEIKKYNIPYNYLTAFNGSVIFDSNNNLINVKYLNNEVTNIIKELYESKSIIKNLIAYDYNGNNSNKNLIVLGLKPNNNIELIKYLKEIKEKHKSLAIRKDPVEDIIWIKESSTKSTGITDLINITKMNLKNNDVYTIGNSYSDLEMITDFNGSFIKRSHINDIWYREDYEKSVASLIKKIK